MATTTNVPSVTFGATGFIVPAPASILGGVVADYQQAFGGNLNLSGTVTATLSTPQGQLASSTAAIVLAADQTFQYYTQQVDPAFAQGRMQDAIGRIYFIERLPSQPTTLQVLCNGLVDVPIPTNSLIQDEAENVYYCVQGGTIPSSGSITLPFAAQIPGPTAVPATDGISIYQSIAGWDTVAVQSGIVGVNVESRAAFELRRQQTVAANSLGSLPSVKGAVLLVPGVTDAYVTENTSAAPVTTGGFQLNANSIYVAVAGGGPNAVARAIWSKKAPGCAYNGNTQIVVQDTSPGYVPPFPSYQVLFEIPAPLQVLFAVSIVSSGQVPSDAVTQIQNAIVSAFSGGDGGPVSRIGGTIYASRFVCPIAALGTWAQILDIQIGSGNTPAASFTGSITGNTLTVTAVASGTLARGQTIVDATETVLPGTTILAFQSGTGNTGTYTLSTTQTVASEAMQAALPNQNLVACQIDQIPTISASNIAVTLS